LTRRTYPPSSSSSWPWKRSSPSSASRTTERAWGRAHERISRIEPS
jgi:hypothetical protein